jgi:predicted enzyme related to lactoylglutathione lyase
VLVVMWVVFDGGEIEIKEGSWMAKIVHFEIPAEDTGRARTFWGTLFGYEFQTMEGPVEYHLFQTGENEGGGIYPRQAGETGLISYFDVEDIDAARQKVQELGGTAEEKAPVEGMGWYARATDTEGNDFSLWQSDATAPTAEQQASGATSA